jgi:signal transduction histidine kinase
VPPVIPPAPGEPRRRTDAARLEIVRLTPGPDLHLPDLFRRVCEIAAETLEVERVGIWFFVEDGAALSCAHLFERSKREHSEGVTLRVSDSPAYFAALLNRKSIPAEVAISDPRTLQLADAYLSSLGITSLLDAPIYQGGSVVGVVCHEHTGPPREWTTEERDFAGSVADQVALKMKAAELHELKAALHTLDAQLAETRRLEALGQFATGIAHDFRNLLTVVLGTSSLLGGRADLPADVREGLKQIEGAAQRGANLTAELLRYSRNQPQATKVLPVAEAVEGMLDLLRAAAGPAHPVEFHATPGSGKAYIDPTQLERVLMNLVVNARDAMPEGGPIRIAVGKDAEANGHGSVFARIEVRDAGAGIDPAHRDRLFEPFFTTKESGKGTGLGLAIVKQIVDRAGGFVRVESAPGRGTAMVVLLPRIAGN